MAAVKPAGPEPIITSLCSGMDKFYLGDAEGEADLVPPDLVASLPGEGEADALALGLGLNSGLGLTVAASGEGDGVRVAVYLPLNQTKYAASKTIIKIITTIVTFRLKTYHPSLAAFKLVYGPSLIFTSCKLEFFALKCTQ